MYMYIIIIIKNRVEVPGCPILESRVLNTERQTRATCTCACSSNKDIFFKRMKKVLVLLRVSRTISDHRLFSDDRLVRENTFHPRILVIVIKSTWGYVLLLLLS